MKPMLNRRKTDHLNARALVTIAVATIGSLVLGCYLTLAVIYGPREVNRTAVEYWSK